MERITETTFSHTADATTARRRMAEAINRLERAVAELQSGESGAGGSGGDNPRFMSKDDLEDELDAYDVDPGDLEGTLQSGGVGQADLAYAVTVAREMPTPDAEEIVAAQHEAAQAGEYD